jgi:hypothetical protein
MSARGHDGTGRGDAPSVHWLADGAGELAAMLPLEVVASVDGVPLLMLPLVEPVLPVPAVPAPVVEEGAPPVGEPASPAPRLQAPSARAAASAQA